MQKDTVDKNDITISVFCFCTKKYINLLALIFVSIVFDTFITALRNSENYLDTLGFRKSFCSFCASAVARNMHNNTKQYANTQCSFLKQTKIHSSQIQKKKKYLQ